MSQSESDSTIKWIIIKSKRKERLCLILELNYFRRKRTPMRLLLVRICVSVSVVIVETENDILEHKKEIISFIVTFNRCSTS